MAAVILRAQESGHRTPMGIAVAVESAQMVMSPEVAAELEELRTRVADVEAERAKLIRWRAEDGKQAAKSRALLSERTRELVEMEADRNRWKARVAELEGSALERARAGLDRLAADLRAAATDPEPEHAHTTVMARGEMDEPLGYYICGICGKPAGGEVR
ncbi:hypothetical protein [Streptomyces tremellae]|uniref:hypothetical protein n=1 Tax=Streptomyces tremellae TaxID=1124239 RepID=UPI0031E6ADE7